MGRDPVEVTVERNRTSRYYVLQKELEQKATGTEEVIYSYKRFSRYDQRIVSALYICFKLKKAVDSDFME